MKKRAILILMIAIVALALPSSALAQKFSYTVGVQVRNMSGTDATISLEYYNSQTAASDPGTKVLTTGDTVLANKSNTYFPIHPTGSFDGSLVISSDQPLASIVNVLALTGSTYRGAGSYVGASTGATSIQVPLLQKDNSGTDTWVSVQNAGTAATTVEVAYSDGVTPTPVKVEAGATIRFDQQNETHPAKVFAGTITSTNSVAGTSVQPLVAVVTQEQLNGVMMVYTGFTSASENLVFPLINVQAAHDIATGILIRNTGGTPTDVTIEYLPSDGSPSCTETQTVSANDIKVFALGTFAGTPPAGTTTDCVGGIGAHMVGSAYVKTNSASQPLVGVVNQLTSSTGAAYGAFDPDSATNQVVLPLIMDRNGGSFTGYSIMNIGGGATDVTCTFSDVDASYNDTATSLGVNQTMVNLQGDKFLSLSKYVGSAICTAANSSDKIIGVVNQVSATGASGDTFLVYEGINNTNN